MRDATMIAQDANKLQRINLIEILKEEAWTPGLSFEEPEDLADRSEEGIRDFFKRISAGCSKSKSDYPPPDGSEFSKWFPGLTISQTACSNPRWQLLCFANAGSAEDMYTNEGTGTRRFVSPLLEWCRANSAECLAVQLPGRIMRKNETPLQSCQAVAEALFPVVVSKLASAPYMVIAHSVGCWNAYEFLMLARARGLPMPARVFLSAMASPDFPKGQRPWREQHFLTEEEFKEECRGWNVNEVVFSPAMWGTYQPLMRADFSLFDQYSFQHTGEPAFDFPITVFWGSQDWRITEEMVHGWKAFTTGPFTVHRMEGHHLWPLQPASKKIWLEQIVKEMSEAISVE